MSIILSQLTKRYGHNVVVNNVSFQIEDGELFVMLGGSGSGKSTILRLIAGLIEPDDGRIEINGRDVTYLSPQARNTGFVFQNYSIFRHMTVSQNVAFGLRIRKIPATRQDQRSADLLELVGLAGLGDRYADQLSGGQRQRVALARALAYEPSVLLLDEPFGALDVKIRAQLRKSLREIQRRLNVTTILVTHDQEEAFELADRIGVIERGQLVEVGTPEALYHRPQTEFTATFIGGGNVLAGRYDNGQIRLGEVTLPMPDDAPVHEPGAPVRILFRPETVQLQNEPFSSQRETAVLGQGRVIERTFAGSWQRITVGIDNLCGVRQVAPQLQYGQLTTRIEVAHPSNTNHDASFAPGQILWVGLKTVHVLEPTGLKLLIHVDPEGGEEAVEAGCRLAQLAGGPVTLLAVVHSAEEVAATRQRLEAMVRPWQVQLAQLHIRVRQGGDDEILLEAQEGNYEIVILNQTAGGDATGAIGLDPAGRRWLLQSGIAVLLVRTAPPNIDRILICTAAGEPGKSDVRLGGRIARRTGSQVTMLHVYRSGATPEERQRIERHLNQARATLNVLGVSNDLRTSIGAVTSTILQEAETGDYDLIVIGAPAPPAQQQIIWPDLASQIARATVRPVLVVPMVEA